MSDEKREAAARAGSHCGDLGHLNQSGSPCGQVTRRGKACPFHESPESLVAHQKKTSLIHSLKQMRLLPENAPAPSFQTRDDIVRWSEQMANLVGQGRLEPKLADSMRGFALLALSAHELAALDRLEKLERVIVKGQRLA